MSITRTYSVTLNKGLKATYYRSEDSLKIKFIASRLSEQDESHNNQTFKQLTLVTDLYGEPDSLIIKGFRKDDWHKNKDLLKYVIVSHFDESEEEAGILVLNLLKTLK